MKKNDKYMINGPEGYSTAEFPRIDLQYVTSKEEAWKNISAKIDSKISQPQQGFFILYRYKFAMAASILLLLGITAFLRFHTVTSYCPAGKHIMVSLPEGSQVELNALSTISYHPYMMSFDRSVRLTGEAYFNVKPGKTFKVISKRGETIVLGTTFNIYSRGADYNVSCFTGAVKVVSILNKETVTLHPNQQAFIQTNGSIRLVKSANIGDNNSWTRNMFIFTGAPLESVIQEIERQYNIIIKTKKDYHLTYTGNFSKSISEKEVLDLVCTSLELKFEAKSNGEYLIYKN